MDVVRTRQFDRDIARIGASEVDVSALVAELAERPEDGDVIKGLGGARKLRFAMKSRNIGKSSGGRAIYVIVHTDDDELFLLAAYGKNEKADLTTADRKAIIVAVEAILED